MSSVRRRTWKNKDGSKTTIWNVDYVDNTRQRVVKGGFKTKAEAERYLHEIRKELEKGSCKKQNKHMGNWQTVST